MEPASTVQGMSFPQNLRPKQREIIEAFAASNAVVAKLPTGYGKTLAAAGSYAFLRHAGTCNRMLYVVPRSNQASQAAESVPLDLLRFGVDTKAIEVVSDPINALRKHRDGSCEVFVVTVQGLSTSAATAHAVRELCATGRWFVVVDEHHHYGEDTTWTEAVRVLPSAAMLAMSATPARMDGTDHFGEPSVAESYRGAAQAGYVKWLSLHAYEYVIDAVTVDGRAIPFTTAEIVREAGESPEEIDKYIASRKMRWSPKYISPLVTYPLDRMINLRTRGIRSQMLVQAMSCTHARMVYEQLRSLLPDHYSVDWVGTGPSGRSPKENADVLASFCPPKDKATGKRPWTLDVLVNVGIASEGLDTTDVTEVVFLTPANITITNLQTIGRGARLIPGLPNQQPVCHVNVDTGSQMAKYAGQAVMDLFEMQAGEPEKCEGCGQLPCVCPGEDPKPNDDYEPLPEKMAVMIVDVRLSDIKTGPLWDLVLGAATVEGRKHGAPEEMIEAAAERAILNHFNRSSNVSSELAQRRQNVHEAAGKIANLVIRRIAKSGVRVEKSLAGDLRRRINGEKKRRYGAVETADEQQLEQHWQFLRQLEAQILGGHELQGVPQWLR